MHLEGLMLSQWAGPSIAIGLDPAVPFESGLYLLQKAKVALVTVGGISAPVFTRTVLQNTIK